MSPSPPVTLATPTLASPLDDALASLRPTLAVNNVASNGGGARTYDFQLADSQASLTGTGTTLVSATGVAEGATGTTVYIVDRDLRPATRYYWRSRAVQTSGAGPWSAAFRFRTDVQVNSAPVIQTLTAGSGRAEVNAEVEVTAVVQDQETNPAGLIYEWSATGGLFIGSGPSVRWRAPSGGTPATHDISLTVIERYTVVDADGRTETRENRTSATTRVRVHDSPREINVLGSTFIDDFIHSERSPEFCVRNFSDNCGGKADELGDIRANRAMFINDPAGSSMGAASLDFYDIASVTRRRAVPPAQAGYAVLLAACRFKATNRVTGATGTAVGTCELTAVYENAQWYLCDSHFLPAAGSIVMSGFRF